jgi:hypothetical protein
MTEYAKLTLEELLIDAAHDIGIDWDSTALNEKGEYL